MSHYNEGYRGAQGGREGPRKDARVEELKDGLRQNREDRARINDLRQDYARVEQRHQVIREIRTSYRAGGADRYE